MDPRTTATARTAMRASHELHFSSLDHPGRAIAIPCNAQGEVDLDALPDRLRLSYLGARAMVGRGFAYPTVRRVH